MIGVLCDAAERAIASEFFELFKTPWEFYTPAKQYAAILASVPAGHSLDAPLVLFYSSNALPVDRSLEISLRPVGQKQMVRSVDFNLPIYGRLAAIEPGDAGLLTTGDGLPVALEFCQASQKIIRAGYDLFAEIGCLLETGQPPENALVPAVEMHIALLRSWLTAAGDGLVEIPPCPAGFPFFACLTHDIDDAGIRGHRLDRTMWGFVYRALVEAHRPMLRGEWNFRNLFKNWLAVLKLPLVLAGLADDFWDHFERYAEIDGERGSTYFIIPFKDQPGQVTLGAGAYKRAVNYDIEDVKRQVQLLVRSGAEIGLHGLDAWHSAAQAGQERSRIEQAAGNGPVGVRMHWLWFDAQSPQILEQAGLSYDSSLGYNDAVGFKNGCLQVFRPIGVQTLVELPLNIQDTALFFTSRMGLVSAEAKQACAQLIDSACRFGGILTINWHGRSLEPDRLWGDFYHWLLQQCQMRHALFGNAQQSVEWFRARRSTTFGQIRWTADHIEVELQSAYSLPDPGFILRVYLPNSDGPGGHSRCLDIPWHGESILHIPLNPSGGEAWPKFA